MGDWPSQGKLPGLEHKAPGFHIFWDHRMVAALRQACFWAIWMLCQVLGRRLFADKKPGRPCGVQVCSSGSSSWDSSPRDRWLFWHAEISSLSASLFCGLLRWQESEARGISLPLLLTSYVTLGESPHLSDLHFLICAYRGWIGVTCWVFCSIKWQ